MTIERGILAETDELIERRELYMALSDPVNGFYNNHIAETHESFEVKQDEIKAFHTYCRTKGFVPLSERKFDEEFKKTVFVRESRITVHIPEKPEGTRIQVWKGVDLIGPFSKTKYSTEKDAFVQDVRDVQGPQTCLENNLRDNGVKDPGHGGHAGHEKGDDS